MKTYQFRSGFTLIELLMVMVIMSILLTISLQIGKAWNASALQSEARRITSEFSQAILLAQKDNLPIEFRFYDAPDEIDVEDLQPRGYQLVRLVGHDPTSQKPIYEYLTEVRYLNNGILFHPNTEYTTLMSQVATPPEESAPLIRGEARAYRSFMFLPNGSTSLARGHNYAFTLIFKSDYDKSPELPKDYRSVVLNPNTGNATLF